MPSVALSVRIVRNTDARFGHRLVFDDLDNHLGRLGVRPVQIAGREERSGPPALRVTVDGTPSARYSLNVNLEIVANTEDKFDRRLVLRGLRSGLAKEGITVRSTESAEAGRGSELALRLT